MQTQTNPRLYRGFFCLSWPSFASLPRLNSLIQGCTGLTQFLCKSEAALVCGFVIKNHDKDTGMFAFTFSTITSFPTTHGRRLVTEDPQAEQRRAHLTFITMGVCTPGSKK